LKFFDLRGIFIPDKKIVPPEAKLSLNNLFCKARRTTICVTIHYKGCQTV
jgi:hypothetical protein